jgi:SAM-dependent methyltransferase
LKTLLHVGCGYRTIRDLGPYFNDGQWSEIRLDINPDVQPDIVAESQDMDLLDDGAVDAVFSSHNIEHVSSFEVPRVLTEFRRVLRDDGILVVLCPDVQQIAQAIVDGSIDGTLYESPAGPITAIDVLYGFQSDLQAGNHYMAHKMAFTSESLARHLMDANFASVLVMRDHLFGLLAVAHCGEWALADAKAAAEALHPQPELLRSGTTYGEFRDA